MYIKCFMMWTYEFIILNMLMLDHVAQNSPAVLYNALYLFLPMRPIYKLEVRNLTKNGQNWFEKEKVKSNTYGQKKAGKSFKNQKF